VYDLRKGGSKDGGSLEIRFDTVRFPAGNEARIRAIAIPLDGKFAEKKGGRWVAKDTKVDRGGTVAVGAIGGFVLGSIFKKQFEGAVIGTLAGILVAENANQNSRDLVLPRGSQIGARLEQDLFVNSDFRETDRNRNQFDRDEDERRVVRDRDDDDRRSAGWPGDERRDDRWTQDRFTSREPVVYLLDRPMTFAKGEQPYVRDGVVMVPLLTMAKRLSLRVDSSGDRFFIENDRDTARIEIGAQTYRLNGRTEDLDVPAEKRNRVVFVPVQLLQEFRNGLRADLRGRSG
jgi:hypothetical protein